MDQYAVWDMGDGPIPMGDAPDDLASPSIQEEEIAWLGKVALSWTSFWQGVLLSTPALAIVIASFVPGLLPPYNNPNLPVTLSLVWWGVLALGGSFCSRSKPPGFLLGVYAVSDIPIVILLILLFHGTGIGWVAIPIILGIIACLLMLDMLVRHLGWRIRLSLAHKAYIDVDGLDSLALYRDRATDISKMKPDNPRSLFPRIFF
ncbi:MAG: hypothetical protein HN964_01915 [Candidatus Jacksonbacteria bacterium]|jgi:hypothetical protein|nr:hypothetical protein [Candidatus Jacksonbacteria bacterium]MBT7008200.1 hypothetical protein [Candidatus Jacksonbacteria bacterium]